MPSRWLRGASRVVGAGIIVAVWFAMWLWRASTAKGHYACAEARSRRTDNHGRFHL